MSFVKKHTSEPTNSGLHLAWLSLKFQCKHSKLWTPKSPLFLPQDNLKDLQDLAPLPLSWRCELSFMKLCSWEPPCSLSHKLAKAVAMYPLMHEKWLQWAVQSARSNCHNSGNLQLRAWQYCELARTTTMNYLQSANAIAMYLQNCKKNLQWIPQIARCNCNELHELR